MMVDLLTGVLVGILLYTVLAMGLNAAGYLPSNVRVTGPIMTIRTVRGRAFLDRLARRDRLWRAWGNLGVGIALVVMVLAGLVVAFTVPAVLTQPDAAAIESPQNVLVIPGVNEFLPVSAAGEIVFGLLVGLVVHEGGHGLLCRVERIDIDSMGVALFALIPLGAFVEPDIDDQREADRGAQIRMFAAGITNNLAVTLLALGGLVLVVSFVSVVPGAPVGDTVAGSGAAEAGIERGDVITHLDGTPIENASQFESTLEDTDADRLTVTREDAGELEVDRRLLVTGAIPGLVEGISLEDDEQPGVESVNGTAVDTEREFAAAVEDRPVAAVETDSGTAELPIGAYVFDIDPDGPMADVDAEQLIVTHVDDTRVSNGSAFGDRIDGLEPGAETTIRGFADGQQVSYDVTVGGTADDPRLGVSVEDGYSGLLFDDFGVDLYPAEQFLEMLGGDAAPGGVSGFLFYHLQLLVLPFATLIMEGMTYNFAGFTADVAGFFAVSGPFAALGGWTLVGVNLLFWTWWINFNLALFNCIPAFPLDGGHIFRTAAESVVSRLPTSYGREIVTALTVSTTLAMVAALLLLVFGPLLFG